jgi:hypothetical protein
MFGTIVTEKTGKNLMSNAFSGVDLDIWSHKVSKCNRIASLCAFVNTCVLLFNQSPSFHVDPLLIFAHGEMRTRINVFSDRYTKPVLEISNVR